MSARSPGGDVAVVIAARNEADRIQATVAAAAGLAGVGLVVVVDDGSKDATAAMARQAGAAVMRHARNRGKGAAMETGAEAVRLIDQREDRDRPRHLLFLDGELGDTAARAAPLIDPVIAGAADMTIAVFAATVKLGGHGLVVGLSGAGIRRATGWQPRQPLNGQRCLTRAAFEAARPLAPRLGRGDRADHRLAAPGPADYRGRGGPRAPGDRHRPARPAAPRSPAHRRRQGARRGGHDRAAARREPAGSGRRQNS